MKKAYTVVIAFILAVGMETGLFAEETPLEGELSCKVSSAYVWRGKAVNDDPVVQPEVVIGKDPFTFDAWGTWDWTEKQGTAQRTRMDLSLDYAFSWEKLFFKAGVVAYIYHDGPEGQRTRDTYEMYFETMLDAVLSPSLIVYYDFEAIDGFYTALSVGHDMALWNGIDLQARAKVGAATAHFNKGFYSMEAQRVGAEEFSPDGGVSDFSASAKLMIPAGERVSVIPALEYTSLLDSELRDTIQAFGFDGDNWITSLTVSWTF